MWEELNYKKLPKKFWKKPLFIYTKGTHLPQDALPFKTKQDRQNIVERLKNGEKLYLFNFTEEQIKKWDLLNVI